ncbi:hypothetical protein P879_11792 [Paragonimus westermani]|uniref:Uncharacterized protein n=1 Tax=Paragonimus westermani TaxID=34504 RepID=A0A8T0D8E2_9TREM|nr:hypothetical protein P879_11792 [Paragonimus westermani]
MEIGEVASRIGHLYHHYHLRTNEPSVLRGYYSKASKEERLDLMVKKLRYYARFIPVCLLLRKMKLVHELLREFTKQVHEYIEVYDSEDRLGWGMVIQEIREFVESESMCTVLDAHSSPVVLTHRLNACNSPQAEKCGSGYLQLSGVLIVGNCYEQMRFSELSLDMYRTLQMLQRDPPGPLMPNVVSRLGVKSGIEILENGISGVPVNEESNGSPRQLNPNSHN